MYDYVLLCITMYYYVLLCITMYYYVLLCITMYYDVLRCITLYYYVLLCITMYYYVLLRITMYYCKSRCVHNMLRCPVNSSMDTSRRILWESLDTQQPFSRRDLPLSRAGKPPIFGKTASTVQVFQRDV